MLVEESISSVLQLSIVLIITGIFYLFAGRARSGFREFTGLLWPTSKSMRWAFITALVIVPLTLATFYLTPLVEAARAENTVAGEFRAQGFSAETAAVIVLVALVKTSLTEEILFRGLIAKRLIRWLGFTLGNSLQAALFGAVHMLIFVGPGGPEFSWATAVAFFGATAGGGWVQAYLNERVGNGSIAPGWLVHSLTNLTAYPLLAFG